MIRGGARLPLGHLVRPFSATAAQPSGGGLFSNVGAKPTLGNALAAAMPGARVRKGMLNPDEKYLLHIKVTPNNCIFSVCDQDGAPKISYSTGMAGFSGTQRSTTVATSHAAEQLGRKMVAKGIRDVDCFLKGFGAGRKAAVKGILKTGIRINAYFERTPVPHGGCKRPKRRRL